MTMEIGKQTINKISEIAIFLKTIIHDAGFKQCKSALYVGKLSANETKSNWSYVWVKFEQMNTKLGLGLPCSSGRRRGTKRMRRIRRPEWVPRWANSFFPHWFFRGFPWHTERGRSTRYSFLASSCRCSVWSIKTEAAAISYWIVVYYYKYEIL